MRDKTNKGKYSDVNGPNPCLNYLVPVLDAPFPSNRSSIIAPCPVNRET